MVKKILLFLIIIILSGCTWLSKDRIYDEKWFIKEYSINELSSNYGNSINDYLMIPAMEMSGYEYNWDTNISKDTSIISVIAKNEDLEDKLYIIPNYEGWNVMIYDSPFGNIDEIINKVNQFNIENEIDIVLLDETFICNPITYIYTPGYYDESAYDEYPYDNWFALKIGTYEDNYVYVIDNNDTLIIVSIDVDVDNNIIITELLSE